LLEFYESLRALRPKNILELGMFEGGSMVYYDKLYAPERLVGIDIRATPIAALERYREGRDHIKTFYKLSQDSPRARDIAQANFPSGIDLVVDDASHLYAQTQASFEMLFPLIKPGGLYVVEDWAWSHRPQYQAPDATWNAQPALTNLIFNLVILTAVSRVISSLTIFENLVCITKGRGTLPETKLDLSHCLRGREMPQI
jgi:cephalosporin hydroxylase